MTEKTRTPDSRQAKPSRQPGFPPRPSARAALSGWATTPSGSSSPIWAERQRRRERQRREAIHPQGVSTRATMMRGCHKASRTARWECPPPSGQIGFGFSPLVWCNSHAEEEHKPHQMLRTPGNRVRVQRSFPARRRCDQPRDARSRRRRSIFFTDDERQQQAKWSASE